MTAAAAEATTATTSSSPGLFLRCRGRENDVEARSEQPPESLLASSGGGAAQWQNLH